MANARQAVQVEHTGPPDGLGAGVKERAGYRGWRNSFRRMQGKTSPARGLRGLCHLRKCRQQTHTELSMGDSHRQKAPLHPPQPPAPAPGEGKKTAGKPGTWLKCNPTAAEEL